MQRELIIVVLTLTCTLSNEPERNVITSNNEFAKDLYKELLKSRQENFVVSPFSAESVLALVQSGARGETQEVLRSGLHLPNDQSLIENSFRSLNSNLKTNKFRDVFGNVKPSQGYAFHIANKLYLQKHFTIKPNFRQIAKDVFDSELENVNFAQRSQTAKIMNDWVERKTESKIRNLISPNKIDSSTKAVVINALYFTGNWSSPFKRFVTRKRDFYTQDGQINQFETMSKFEDERTFNYADNPDLKAQFLELPFQNGDVSMVFALPYSRLGIGELEGQIERVLEPQNWSRDYVNMTIPKFRIDSKIDIKALLQNLGVRTPFSAKLADFRDISDKNLFISDIIQKTFIDVHESGVEAASATYAGFTLLSFHSTPEFKQFNADHPFIFYIKIKDLIVFLGRVGRPTY